MVLRRKDATWRRPSVIQNKCVGACLGPRHTPQSGQWMWRQLCLNSVFVTTIFLHPMPLRRREAQYEQFYLSRCLTVAGLPVTRLPVARLPVLLSPVFLSPRLTLARLPVAQSSCFLVSLSSRLPVSPSFRRLVFLSPRHQI